MDVGEIYSVFFCQYMYELAEYWWIDYVFFFFDVVVVDVVVVVVVVVVLIVSEFGVIMGIGVWIVFSFIFLFFF